MGKIRKGVTDLGVAAYMLMHKYPLAGKQDKTIIFQIDDDKEEEFQELKNSYLFSEYHYFDHCLMGLKKMDESKYDLDNCKFVTDLGAAAFLLMHKFRITGKKGRAYYFNISDEEEARQFDEYNLEYSTSDFHEFDSKLMSVKKIGEFVK